jgi:LPXTG-motif cell wall-anchored protein
MIQPMIHKATSFILFVCLAATAFAQGDVVIKAQVDKNKIVIGEQIELRLEADIPENAPIRFFSLDSLPHFEILSREKIDTTNTSSGTVLSQRLLLTSFDSGSWVIPPFVLGGQATDSIPVEVGFSPFDPNQDYHDIKDVIDVEAEEKKKEQWWWYAAGGAVLLALILYLLLRKKKKPVVPTGQPPVNPYEEAMKLLDQLQRERPAAKQYYSVLVDVFRQYADKRKNIHSQQKTSDDIIVQLQSLEMNKAVLTNLVQALRMSDFVKFAKYEPATTDITSSFEAVKAAIMDIEKTVKEEEKRTPPPITTTPAPRGVEKHLREASPKLMNLLVFALEYVTRMKKENLANPVMPFAVFEMNGQRTIHAYPEGYEKGMQMLSSEIKTKSPDYVVFGSDGTVKHEGETVKAILFKAYDKNDTVVYQVAQRYDLTTPDNEFQKIGNPAHTGNENKF